MSPKKWAVGVDFGGTNIKVGLVNDRRRVVEDTVLPTRTHADPARFLDGLVGAVHRLAGDAGIAASRLRGIGIGAPGLIDTDRGIVHRLVNVRGWRDVPLARLVTGRLGCLCAIDNDATLVTLGEWRLGAGRGAHDLVCLTLGTGVGGGLIFHGRLYRGASGTAAEIGHMVLVPGGPRCACGNRGCLEAFIGTAALLKAGSAAIRRGDRRLRTLAHRRGGLSPAVLAEAAEAGDRIVRRLWRQFGERLGVGLTSVINLLNPERIVIGGGVANAWRFFVPGMQQTIRRQALGVPARAVRIVRAQLGDLAGVLGAAVLVWDHTSDE